MTTMTTGNNPDQRKYVVRIRLDLQQLEAFYAGKVTQVWVRDLSGVSLQFPLTQLRRFITHTGIQGTFNLRVNENNQLVGISRVL